MQRVSQNPWYQGVGCEVWLPFLPDFRTRLVGHSFFEN